MQALPVGDAKCLILRFVEIFAELNEPRPEQRDRRILIGGIALRYVNRRGNAGACRGEGNRLPVIAAGRRDHAGNFRLRSAQTVQVHDAAANFEGPGRRVILMLDEYLASHTALELGPGVSRRRRHHAVDQRRGALQLSKLQGNEWLRRRWLKHGGFSFNGSSRAALEWGGMRPCRTNKTHSSRRSSVA